MEPLRVNERLVLPPEELSVAFARSGGPGGQNVNKVATKVVLRFSIEASASLGETRRARLLGRLASRLTGSGELLVQASRYRERGRNLADARERLAAILREALQVQRPRRATRPTAGSKRRRLEAKRRRGELKRRRGAEE
ncbi:MAG: aminoacyl-tRNA hydrolase [Planctomycetota bacterium]|nr:MAG: aminoacyl-tRNA hydrolase [Planctomycetota bacterium]